MNNNKEEELEFISVRDLNDVDDFGNNNMNTNYYQDEGDEKVGALSYLKLSKQPVCLLFHVLFKSLALFLYIFGSWITSSFVLTFVFCIILLAFDFWTVKNVSGRLLVGLRWWSHVKEDGSNEWMFESLEDMDEISSFDSRIFWGTLYATPCIWALLFVIGILRLKFEYLPIVAAAIAMNGANVVGYYKCSNDAKEKMQSLMSQGLRDASAAALGDSSILSWIMRSLVNFDGSKSSSNV